MDRAEVIRRLKAARALGGYTTPASLAKHPLLLENDIKDSRLRELESIKGRADVRPMELEIIARACGLPPEFFSATFDRMADSSLAEEVAALREEIRMVLDETAASRMTRAVLAAGQATERPAGASQSGRHAKEQRPGRQGQGG